LRNDRLWSTTNMQDTTAYTCALSPTKDVYILNTNKQQ